MQLALIGGKSASMLASIVKETYDYVQPSVFGSLQAFVDTMRTRSTNFTRLFLLQDVQDSLRDPETILTEFCNYVSLNVPEMRVVTISRDVAHASVFASIFFAPTHVNIVDVKPKVRVLGDFVVASIDAIKDTYPQLVYTPTVGTSMAYEDCTPEADSTVRGKNKSGGKGGSSTGLVKTLEKQQGKMGLFRGFGAGGAKERKRRNKGKSGDVLGGGGDADVSGDLDNGFASDNTGNFTDVTSFAPISFGSLPEGGLSAVAKLREQTFVTEASLGSGDLEGIAGIIDDVQSDGVSTDSGVDLPDGFGYSPEDEFRRGVSDDGFSVESDNGFSEESAPDLSNFGFTHESGGSFTSDGNVEVYGSAEQGQPSVNWEGIQRNLAEAREGTRISIGDVDLWGTQSGLGDDFAGVGDSRGGNSRVGGAARDHINIDTVGALDVDLGREHGEYTRAIERPPEIREVIKEVVVNAPAVGSLFSRAIQGKSPLSLIVTGDRRSGTTTTALNIAQFLAKNSKVLYVDFDFKHRGSIFYLGMDDLIQFEDHQLNGLGQLQSVEMLKSLSIVSRYGFDCLISMLGNELQLERYTVLQELLSVQKQYPVVIYDVPLSDLHMFDHLLMTSKLLICVEANVTAYCNTLLALDELNSVARVASLVLLKGKYGLTKYNNVSEFNEVKAFVADVMTPDGDSIDFRALPFIGGVNDVSKALNALLVD